MSFLNVSKVSRHEGENHLIKGISFTQNRFQKTAIAGATGSGKSTLLKMMAGLLQPTEGSIYFEGEKVHGPEEKLLPGHTAIAYLSQHFELRNHYRVEEILAMANQLTNEEAATVYEICRISNLVKRWTHQLSGGEKQRIALARLLVAKPRLLLLDEPYSNLDPIHKNLLKKVINDVVEGLQLTCILVSHDPLDTLSWADEIVVLKDGGIIQQGSPEEIYNKPLTKYTAALFGKYTVLNPMLTAAFNQLLLFKISLANRFLRPENFTFVNEGQGIKGIVTAVRYSGDCYEVEVDAMDSIVIMKSHEYKPAVNDIVYFSIRNSR